jgi:hypothetical protein
MYKVSNLIQLYIWYLNFSLGGLKYEYLYVKCASLTQAIFCIRKVLYLFNSDFNIQKICITIVYDRFYGTRQVMRQVYVGCKIRLPTYAQNICPYIQSIIIYIIK